MKIRDRKWVELWWEECPECGNNVEVLTESKQINLVYNDELARCIDTDCRKHSEGGGVYVFDGTAYINWD